MILRVKPAVVGIITEVSAELTIRCGKGDTYVVKPEPTRERHGVPHPPERLDRHLEAADEIVPGLADVARVRDRVQSLLKTQASDAALGRSFCAGWPS